MTPKLSLIVNESPSRRSRYEERMRKAGRVKVTLWMDAELVDPIRSIAAASRSEHPVVRAAASSIVRNAPKLFQGLSRTGEVAED